MIGISILSSVASIGIYDALRTNKSEKSDPASSFGTIAQLTDFHNLSAPTVPVDFRLAANITTPTVVHIKKTYAPKYSNNDPWKDFFGDNFSPFFFGTPKNGEPQKEMASGSGVIIGQDGYIVTNNHMISDAEKVEVTLFDNRSYEATVIGADPSTDIALIKIEEKDLPHIAFGNSDSVDVGEWVMAVGNPFDLTSTVTAGIISAKGRNINILGDQSNAPIESFLQTDAAVNPGNSGGALVNASGELIGINTAIASPTGAYAGYSFAVPVNIVKKVVDDLMKFGTVQRGYLGVSISNITSEMANELDIEELKGVYVNGVNEGSGAYESGLQEGDIITSVDSSAVHSVPELQEHISQYRPGDKVKVDYFRNGTAKSVFITLKNSFNNTKEISESTANIINELGADFEVLSNKELNDYGIEGGLKVKQILRGKIANNTNMRKGFIITKVDHKTIKTIDDLTDIIGSKQTGEGVLIEGFYPQYPNKKYYYAFGI